MRLKPLDPVMMPNVLNGYANACFLLHRHEEAVSWARKMLVLRPNDINGLGLLAVNVSKIGQVEEAREVTARIRALYPHLRGSAVKAIFHSYYRRPEDRKICDE